jgi:hypothetical protein
MALAAALEPAGNRPPVARPSRRRGTAPAKAMVESPAPGPDAVGDPSASSGAVDSDPATSPTEDEAGPRAVSATERRRAVERLLGLWLDVARDVVLVRADGARSVRDTVLLEELTAIAAAIAPGAAEGFLHRGARAAELLEANVSPELILDSVVLAWPGRAGSPT